MTTRHLVRLMLVVNILLVVIGVIAGNVITLTAAAVGSVAGAITLIKRNRRTS